MIVVGSTNDTTKTPMTNASTSLDTLLIASQISEPLSLISYANVASITTEIKMHTICITLIHFLFLTWTSKDISATSADYICNIYFGTFCPKAQATDIQNKRRSPPRSFLRA